MAAVLPPAVYENPELAHEVNVGGTRILVDLIKEKGGHIPFVFTSSVAVFGPTPGAEGPVSVESCIPEPVETYGETKLKAEEVIRESGIDYLILRLTAIMYLSFDLSDMNRIFSIPLDNRLEFCHPDDLAVAVGNALKKFDAIKGNTLVVSGGPEQRMLFRDMVGGILGVMGLPLPPKDKFTREPYFLDWYDTSRSQELLKFQRKGYADYIKDFSRGLTQRYTRLFIPAMRYCVSPIFGTVVLRILFRS
jgi:nucleoside-diphosphate-sugar epimerase